MKNLVKTGMAIMVVTVLSVVMSSSDCPPGEMVGDPCPVPDPPYTVMYPHSSSPYHFYHCSNGVPICKKCPGDLIFNSDLNVCDWAVTVTCSSYPAKKTNNSSGRCWIPFGSSTSFCVTKCVRSDDPFNICCEN